MEELERKCREACPTIYNMKVQRFLIFDTFHEEFVDDPDHILADKDKVAFHFDTLPVPSASPSTFRPAETPRTPGFTRQSTLAFQSDGTLALSTSPPKVQSNLDTPTKEELEEKSKIYGRDGKKI